MCIYLFLPEKTNIHGDADDVDDDDDDGWKTIKCNNETNFQSVFSMWFSYGNGLFFFSLKLI